MADQTEIMDALDALETHCRAPLMSTDRRTLWLADWCADLAKYEIEHIRAGTRQWRQNANNTKFPTPGQLIPLIQSAALRASPSEAAAVSEWSMPSRDQFEKLSLFEKVRTCLIVSAQLRERAMSLLAASGSRNIVDMPADGAQALERAEQFAKRADGYQATLRTAEARQRDDRTFQRPSLPSF